MEIEKIVTEFIEDRAEIAELEPDLNIFEEGIVNSLFAIDLMTYLERTFQIKIVMEDLNMDNFASINAIVAFVNGKRC